MAKIKMDLRERLLGLMIPEPMSGCWLWTGSTNRKGYGSFSMGKNKNAAAHRVSYEVHKGPIPAGHLICHTCDVPGCINPGHLYAGTAKQNTADMVARKRCFGEIQGSSKLTNEDVLEIREIHARGLMNDSQLSRCFGMHSSAIHLIVKYKRWRHLA